MNAPTVLIAGIATRGLAESAFRAGYEVGVVDGFGDLDLLEVARPVLAARGPAEPFDPRRAAQIASALEAAAVVYTSPFENWPRAVSELTQNRRLLGNSPDVLRAVRDPLRLSRALGRMGVPALRVRSTPPRRLQDVRWLLKPRASGGGHHIVPWRQSHATPPRHSRRFYYQEHIAGIAGSILFAANGEHAALLGLTRMLVGEAGFGASGFRYCGSIVAANRDEKRWQVAGELARGITRQFGLMGVNGIDVVWRDRTPYVLEVNPRYTAAMEVVERASGVSIFGIHVAACSGTLLSEPGASGEAAVGKAIVYARDNVSVGDTSSWLSDPSVRDIPIPHSFIPRGGPVCTVLAHGRTGALCHRALVARARRVYASLGSMPRRRSA